MYNVLKKVPEYRGNGIGFVEGPLPPRSRSREGGRGGTVWNFYIGFSLWTVPTGTYRYIRNYYIGISLRIVPTGTGTWNIESHCILNLRLCTPQYLHVMYIQLTGQKCIQLVACCTLQLYVRPNTYSVHVTLECAHLLWGEDWSKLAHKGSIGLEEYGGPPGRSICVVGLL